MLLDKLIKILNKYKYDCDGKLNILTNSSENLFVNRLKRKIEELEINKKIKDQCIVIFWYENIVIYSDEQIKQINDCLNKNITALLIVPMNFDFDHLVKNTTANNYDVISWHGKNKIEQYIIVISKY
jgi:hypothetical protein